MDNRVVTIYVDVFLSIQFPWSYYHIQYQVHSVYSDRSALYSLEGSNDKYYPAESYCTPAEGVTFVLNLGFTSSGTSAKRSGR